MTNEQPPRQPHSPQDDMDAMEYVLGSVWEDNVGGNQIDSPDGQTGGISEEAARDIGFHSVEEAKRFSPPPEIAPKLDSVSDGAKILDINGISQESAGPDELEAAKDRHPAGLGQKPDEDDAPRDPDAPQLGTRSEVDIDDQQRDAHIKVISTIRKYTNPDKAK